MSSILGKVGTIVEDMQAAQISGKHDNHGEPRSEPP
jgi:hypothetical protein